MAPKAVLSLEGIARQTVFGMCLEGALRHPFDTYSVLTRTQNRFRTEPEHGHPNAGQSSNAEPVLRAHIYAYTRRISIAT